MMKKFSFCIFPCLMISLMGIMTGCGTSSQESDAIVLRVANWEEYIDEGDWDEEEAIELEDGTVIFGENSLVDDFEDWFYENYGREVKVEYSTFGTCEELYNQLTIGDVYDVGSPSEYMIMKMMREGMVVPFSDEFKDANNENSYYTRNVSPYIQSRLDELSIDNMTLSDYAAGYMWGTLGIVYNPELVSHEEASHWSLLVDNKYNKQITVKDSVRDAYFGAITYYYFDDITNPDFINSADYHDKLSEVLNRTDVATVDGVENVLSDMKENAYSFETDSGKADLVTGKVVASEQWSGDAVYSMDQADEDEVELCYAAPDEGTNLWFDGWIMFDCGVGDDPDKQMAAEAWVNFLSMPENAIRNMYYIGYTSVISGGDSPLVYEYIDYNYSAEEDEEDVVDYPIGYFFDYGNPNADEEYTIVASESQIRRQLGAQYPTKDVVDRSVVMACFDEESNIRINRMWTNVRCFDLRSLFN